MSFSKAVLTLCLLFSLSARKIFLLCAQEVEVPVEVQIPLFLKILTYDKNLDGHGNGAVTIGIVYTDGDRRSEDLRSELETVIQQHSGKTLKGYPIRYLSLPFVSKANLEELIKRHGIQVLYVAVADLGDVEAVTEVSHAGDVLTVSGDKEHLLHGVSVALSLKDRRPEIIINLSASRMEGTDFSAHLLKLCRVIQ